MQFFFLKSVIIIRCGLKNKFKGAACRNCNRKKNTPEAVHLPLWERNASTGELCKQEVPFLHASAIFWSRSDPPSSLLPALIGSNTQGKIFASFTTWAFTVRCWGLKWGSCLKCLPFIGEMGRLSEDVGARTLLGPPLVFSNSQLFGEEAKFWNFPCASLSEIPTKKIFYLSIKKHKWPCTSVCMHDLYIWVWSRPSPLV